MKKKLLLLPITCLFLYLGLSSWSAGPGTVLNADLTGASGTATCSTGSSCHSSSSSTITSPTVAIQFLDAGTPVTTYTGSHAYTIHVVGTQISSTLSLPNFGFQVAPVLTSTTTYAGTMTMPAGGHIGIYGPSIHLAEHSSALPATTGTGGAGTTYVVDIPWTSPIAGSGSVSIFAIINAVNFNGSADAGDKWGHSSVVIPESAVVLSSITGTMNVCCTSSATLSDATPGGTWSSSNPAVATIGSTTGVYTGITAGTATITYSVTSAGAATTIVTVNPLPSVGSITGSSIACVGYTASLADVAGPGTWTSSNTAIATVSSSGVVTGVATGTASISCTYSNACGSASAIHTMTINPHSMCSLGLTTSNNNTSPALSVFPNPNDGTFSINMTSDKTEPVDIMITNLTGAIVRQFSTTTNNQSAIDFGNNTPGLYFISATSANGKYYTKMIIR